MKTDLALHGQCVELPLEVLPAAAVAAYVASAPAGPALPPAVVARAAPADGRPPAVPGAAGGGAACGRARSSRSAGHWELPGGLAAFGRARAREPAGAHRAAIRRGSVPSSSRSWRRPAWRG